MGIIAVFGAIAVMGILLTLTGCGPSTATKTKKKKLITRKIYTTFSGTLTFMAPAYEAKRPTASIGFSLKLQMRNYCKRIDFVQMVNKNGIWVLDTDSSIKPPPYYPFSISGSMGATMQDEPHTGIGDSNPLQGVKHYYTVAICTQGLWKGKFLETLYWVARTRFHPLAKGVLIAPIGVDRSMNWKIKQLIKNKQYLK
jgi:hypothetical protein